MNELECLWHEFCHIQLLIPDTLIIKNQEIKDWLYTSSKGHIMKHKKSSVTISRIFEVFSATPCNPIAILYQQGFENALSPADFEALLVSIDDRTCASDFVLQRYIRPEQKAIVSVNFLAELVSISENTSAEIEEEVIGQSRRVMMFLNSNTKSLTTASLAWALNDKSLLLTCLKINREKEPIVRSTSAHSHKQSLPPQSARVRRRPLTASTEIKSGYIRRNSVSSSKFNTSIMKKGVEIGMQTDQIPNCECDWRLKEGLKELEEIQHENSELERIIQLTIEQGKLRRSTVEDKWKAKCLEISTVISDMIYEEKSRTVREIERIKCNKMSLNLSYFSYAKNERGFELMKEKSKLLELKGKIDAERLATKNFKLEARLLRMKLDRIKGDGLKQWFLPKLSPKNVQHIRYKTVSLTPHPRKPKEYFNS